MQTPKPPRSLFAPGGAEVWVLGGHRSVPPTPHGCGAAGCPSGTLGLCWLRGSRRCPRPQSFASWSAKRHLNYFVGSRRSRRPPLIPSAPPPAARLCPAGSPWVPSPRNCHPRPLRVAGTGLQGVPPPPNRSSCSPGMNGESRGGGPGGLPTSSCPLLPRSRCLCSGIRAFPAPCQSWRCPAVMEEVPVPAAFALGRAPERPCRASPFLQQPRSAVPCTVPCTVPGPSGLRLLPRPTLARSGAVGAAPGTLLGPQLGAGTFPVETSWPGRCCQSCR